MPRYSYTAYDSTGTRTSGEIDSETKDAALASLFRQGWYPLDITEATSVKKPAWWEREVFGGNVSQKTLTHLTRELATLVKAELPLDEALRIVVLQPMMNARARQVIGGVLSRVLEGAALSEALRAQGNIPEYYWRIVQAGESSGTLGQTLDELAKFLERSSEFRARITSALMYPLMLLVAAGVALVVIMTVLIPSIVPLFKDAGTEPPFIIAFLAGAQAALVEHWIVALAGFGALAAAVLALRQSASVRFGLDRALLRIPVLSGIVQNAQTAMMARTLATLIRNGVPMLQALQIVGNLLTNRAMAAAVHACASDMREGSTLAGPLSRSGVFPELSLRLIGVGEQAGQLEVMLQRVADIYEATLQQHLTRAANLLTPILTVFIGGMVGGLLLSVMGAIVSLNDLALQ
jgi:general secretion pathway protein F